MRQISGRCTVAVLAATAIALTGCSSVTSGHADTSRLTGATLGAQIALAAKNVKTAHMTMTAKSGPLTATASGDEQLSNGTCTAMDIREHISNVGTLRMIVVAGKLYLKLPASLNPTNKPWVRVSPTTNNPTMKAFVPALDQITHSASISQYAIMSEATNDVQDQGPDEVNGVVAAHYSLTVLIDRLPSAFPGRSALQATGLTSVPLDIWVDGKDRVVKTIENLAVGAQTSNTEVTMSAFNKPVTISAPPANQVATP